MPDKKKYVGLLVSNAIRDVQACKAEDPDIRDDDSWYDVEDPELFLGIYSGTEAECRAAAAHFAMTHESNIRLVEV